MKKTNDTAHTYFANRCSDLFTSLCCACSKPECGLRENLVTLREGVIKTVEILTRLQIYGDDMSSTNILNETATCLSKLNALEGISPFTVLLLFRTIKDVRSAFKNLQFVNQKVNRYGRTWYQVFPAWDQQLLMKLRQNDDDDEDDVDDDFCNVSDGTAYDDINENDLDYDDDDDIKLTSNANIRLDDVPLDENKRQLLKDVVAQFTCETCDITSISPLNVRTCCYRVAYCSDKCQEQHRIRHDSSCSKGERVDPPVTDTDVYALFDALVLLGCRVEAYTGRHSFDLDAQHCRVLCASEVPQRCVLCWEHEPILHSHIIDAGTMAYFSSHKSSVFWSQIPSQGHSSMARIIQKPLLCHTCENLFSGWENEASTLWGTIFDNNDAQETVQQCTVEYNVKLYLYAVSIAFRVAIMSPSCHTGYTRRFREILLNGLAVEYVQKPRDEESQLFLSQDQGLHRLRLLTQKVKVVLHVDKNIRSLGNSNWATRCWDWNMVSNTQFYSYGHFAHTQKGCLSLAVVDTGLATDHFAPFQTISAAGGTLTWNSRAKHILQVPEMLTATKVFLTKAFTSRAPLSNSTVTDLRKHFVDDYKNLPDSQVTSYLPDFVKFDKSHTTYDGGATLCLQVDATQWNADRPILLDEFQDSKVFFKLTFAQVFQSTTSLLQLLVVHLYTPGADRISTRNTKPSKRETQSEVLIMARWLDGDKNQFYCPQDTERFNKKIRRALPSFTRVAQML